MKKKMILLAVGLTLVVLLAAATVFYQDLSQQYATDPIISVQETEPESTVQEPEASDDAQQPEAPAEEQKASLALAPEFTVFDGEGTEVHLSDYLGKPVVINFWASWCDSCKRQMPAFQQAWETYGDRVEFLLINLTDNQQETVDSAKQFLNATEYTFPVYFDTQHSGAIAYGVYGIPVTYLVDKDGYLVAGANSALNYDTLEYGISLILDE